MKRLCIIGGVCICLATCIVIACKSVDWETTGHMEIVKGAPDKM